MPKLFMIGSYTVYFWSNVGSPLEPVHIHISQSTPSSNGTKVWISEMGHALLANNNADISEPQLRKLLREIEANSEEIVARWEVMAKVNMTLRVDPELKIEAAKLFKELGMDLSTATGIFYRQALRHHGIPFDICLDEPNETTYAAMEEAEQMLRDTNARKFSSVDELFGELDS